MILKTKVKFLNRNWILKISISDFSGQCISKQFWRKLVNWKSSQKSNLWKLMLYPWSCNQSVAWKCRHLNMLRPKIYWTKSQRNLAKFQNFEKFNIIQICTDVTVLLHSIWELLSKALFAFTFDYMYFFQFLPQETGRNTFFPVSSILPGRNLFLPEVSEPCPIL